jgi:hypothetical protein
MTTALGRLTQQEAYEIANGNDRVTVNVLSRMSTEGSADARSRPVSRACKQMTSRA